MGIGHSADYPTRAPTDEQSSTSATSSTSVSRTHIKPTVQPATTPTTLSGWCEPASCAGCAAGPLLTLHSPVAPADVTERHDAVVVSPELAVLQVCGTSGQRAAMIAAEAGLRMGLVCREELASRARGAHWGPTARHVVALADRYSESAGESWCRWCSPGWDWVSLSSRSTSATSVVGSWQGSTSSSARSGSSSSSTEP